MEQIRSADVLANFPQVDEEKLNAALAAEAAASNRKIIVLDDDPTGVQTVHDIYVYTDWTAESLRKGFAAPEKLFFILTNSRGFTVAETTKAHREIAENTAKVAREFGMDYLIISRGDSTLRGHYPLETDLLREVTEAENGYKMDGDILCPYFREGGRFTLDNVHYVRYGAELVPCGQTEFAKDETFGYHASNLCEYIEEKTGGKVRAGDVTCISLESLRAMDFDGIEAQLLAVHDYGHEGVCSGTVPRHGKGPSLHHPQCGRTGQGHRQYFRPAAAHPGKDGHAGKQGRRHHRGGQPHQKDHCPAGRTEKSTGYRVY